VLHDRLGYKCAMLDEINLKLIALLQQNGRMTNAELAERTGLSPASTLERVRKLERNGIITGYTARVDADRLGRSTLLFVAVSLRDHALDAIHRFKGAIESLPEVMACYHITGGSDYLLKVRVADMNGYEDFLIHKLMEIKQIGHIETRVVMSTLKDRTEIMPLD